MRSLNSRSAAAWLLSIPLMGAGSQVAHAFAYRLVFPDARVRLRDLVATGHGYIDYAPFVAGLAGALELVAFAWILVSAVRGRRRARVPPPWAFAALPPLAFALQELAERWLASGSFPWWAFLQPTFGAGLLLQLPFALLAYVAARLLLRTAQTVAATLRGTAARPRLARLATVRHPLPVWALPATAWADGHPVRGPPLLATIGTSHRR
jgi:hypothetical protein